MRTVILCIMCILLCIGSVYLSSEIKDYKKMLKESIRQTEDFRDIALVWELKYDSLVKITNSYPHMKFVVNKRGLIMSTNSVDTSIITLTGDNIAMSGNIQDSIKH